MLGVIMRGNLPNKMSWELQLFFIDVSEKILRYNKLDLTFSCVILLQGCYCIYYHGLIEETQEQSW